jgi:NAD+ synthase
MAEKLSELLDLNPTAEIERITASLREDVHGKFRRRGGVVGLSGGVDSAVVLALCVQALGAEKVLAVLMPEDESSPESAPLARSWAEELGVEWVVEDVTDALDGLGCYRRRDEAIRRVFPEFGQGWKSKITLPGSLLEDDRLNMFTLTVVDPDGEEYKNRVVAQDYYQIVAASNFKQRVRMSMLYYHAELRNFAVIGTANKNEHGLGFFVKHGDGGVDIAPILHLFKTQVYQLAEILNVPVEIRERTPTSDTYSAGSTQEEFFFRIPFDVLDTVWAAWEANYSAEQIGAQIDLPADQVQRVIDDIIRKQRTTAYLREQVLQY